MSSPSVIFTNQRDSDRKSSAASTATTAITTTLSAASESTHYYTGPGSLLIDKLARQLTHITGSFLDYTSWNRISETSRGALYLFRQLQPLQDTRKRTYSLLKTVLKAEPKSVDSALTVLPAIVNPRVEKIISDFVAAQNSLISLAPTAASDLSKLNTTATSKTSSTSASSSASESPKPCIVLIKSPRKEAYFSKKTKAMETIRTWTAISPLEAAAWCGDNFIVRRLLKQVVTPEQKKEAAKQLQGILDRPETAENGIYLAPFKLLIEGYKHYIAQYDELSRKKEWGKLNELWLSWVGARQRLLSTYGLQEFCSIMPFNPIPSFTVEPHRTCRLYNGSNLELDDLGFLFSLYKAGSPAAVASFTGAPEPALGAADSSAVSRLCEVRTSELGVIIKELNSVNSNENTASASHSQIQLKTPSS